MRSIQVDRVCGVFGIFPRGQSAIVVDVKARLAIIVMNRYCSISERPSRTRNSAFAGLICNDNCHKRDSSRATLFKFSKSHFDYYKASSLARSQKWRNWKVSSPALFIQNSNTFSIPSRLMRFIVGWERVLLVKCSSCRPLDPFM